MTDMGHARTCPSCGTVTWRLGTDCQACDEYDAHERRVREVYWNRFRVAKAAGFGTADADLHASMDADRYRREHPLNA